MPSDDGPRSYRQKVLRARRTQGRGDMMSLADEDRVDLAATFVSLTAEAAELRTGVTEPPPGTHGSRGAHERRLNVVSTALNRHAACRWSPRPGHAVALPTGAPGALGALGALGAPGEMPHVVVDASLIRPPRRHMPQRSPPATRIAGPLDHRAETAQAGAVFHTSSASGPADGARHGGDLASPRAPSHHPAPPMKRTSG